MIEGRKIIHFLKRDLAAIVTYKLAFSMQFFSMAFNLLYLVVFGSMFNASPDVLNPYGGDFISYVVVGSIGWGFLWLIMSATASSIRQEMMMGTLESILLTPTKLHTMILGYSMFGLTFGLMSIVMLIVVGFTFFGVVVFTSATIWTLIIFVVSAIMMIGVGMIFAGLTIWQKNIGQTAPLLQNVTMFFCGVYFPIAVLPSYLQPVSKAIPFYYAIEGLRKSLLNPSTLEMTQYLIILIGSTIVILTIGLFTLNQGVQKAKKDGSLAFY